MASGLGQLVGGLCLAAGLIGCDNNPNPSMVEVARSLAPPETTVTDVGENIGSRIIVGDYFAIAETDDGGLSADALLEAATAHADAQGWALVEREENPGGTTLSYVRGDLNATIIVPTGGDAPSARIRVWED